MATRAAENNPSPPAKAPRQLDHKIHPIGVIGFLAVLLAGLAYAATSVSSTPVMSASRWRSARSYSWASPC